MSSAVERQSAKSRLLSAWLREDGGFVHESLDLLRSAAEEYGVFATRKIARGELLLRVPSSKCIFFADDDEPAQVRLASALAGKLDKGDAAFAPYLESLPVNPEVVEAWTEKERALLRGTSLKGYATMSQEPKNKWLRAARLVRTRAVEVDSGWCLAPGVDALNDYRGICASAATRLRVVTTANSFELVMVAERDIEEGEVTHCYDREATAAQLLERYGFYYSGNEVWPSSCDLSLDLIVGACCLTADKKRLDLARCVLSPHDAVSVTVQEPLPDSLLALCVVLLMPPAELASLNAADAADLDAAAIIADDAEFAGTVVGALVRAAETALDRFARDAEFQDSGPRCDAARALRDAECACLAALLAAAKGLLSPGTDRR